MQYHSNSYHGFMMTYSLYPAIPMTQEQYFGRTDSVDFYHNTPRVRKTVVHYCVFSENLWG